MLQDDNKKAMTDYRRRRFYNDQATQTFFTLRVLRFHATPFFLHHILNPKWSKQFNNERKFISSMIFGPLVIHRYFIKKQKSPGKIKKNSPPTDKKRHKTTAKSRNYYPQFYDTKET